MSWARLIGHVADSELARLSVLAESVPWKGARGRDYQTADITEQYGWTCRRAFFVKIPAGGKMHRHSDVGDCVTEHVVLETNDGCLNFWADLDGEHSVHMERGCRYEVERLLEHWAENNGETDRIHLIVEM